MFDQALAEVERWRPLTLPAVRWSSLAYINGRAGRTADARHAIHELLQLSEREPIQARSLPGAMPG
jgi:Flp pilus assembly protein TadD